MESDEPMKLVRKKLHFLVLKSKNTKKFGKKGLKIIFKLFFMPENEEKTLKTGLNLRFIAIEINFPKAMKR